MFQVSTVLLLHARDKVDACVIDARVLGMRQLPTAAVIGAGSGGKRERTKAANRAAILDAATEVFAEVGYGATTVRDIVRRTDLATGTFYNYFPDKEAVLHALLDEAATEARARVREARRSATT